MMASTTVPPSPAPKRPLSLLEDEEPPAGDAVGEGDGAGEGNGVGENVTLEVHVSLTGATSELASNVNEPEYCSPPGVRTATHVTLTGLSCAVNDATAEPAVQSVSVASQFQLFPP